MLANVIIKLSFNVNGLILKFASTLFEINREQKGKSNNNNNNNDKSKSKYVKILCVRCEAIVNNNGNTIINYYKNSKQKRKIQKKKNFR